MTLKNLRKDFYLSNIVKAKNRFAQKSKKISLIPNRLTAFEEFLNKSKIQMTVLTNIKMRIYKRIFSKLLSYKTED